MSDQPAQFPQGYVQDPVSPYRERAADPWETLRPAGFAIRAGARVVDGVALAIGGVAVGAVWGVVGAVLQVAGVIPAGFAERAGHLAMLNMVLGLVGDVGYHALSESRGGASLGKLVFGLRVVRSDLARPSIGAGLIRSLAFLVDALFFGLVGYSAMSSSARLQRYGDRWADTVVVHAEGAPPQVAGAVGTIALWIFLAWCVDAVCISASSVSSFFGP